jgi:hypothetical protein
MQNGPYSDVSTHGREEDEHRRRRRANMVMYFIYLYENRTVKPAEIILRRGEGGETE